MVNQENERDRLSTLTAAAGLATGDVDIASRADQRRIGGLADELVDSGASTEELRAAGADPDQPLDLRVAIKLALSKHALRTATWSGRLGVVFAMWGEQRRLRPRDDFNPTGEDALHVKLDQLEWLFSGTDVDWRIYPVDDGDPDDSAAVAEERAAEHECGHRVQVLRLAEAIPALRGPMAGLRHVDDSRKGGAIVLGAQVGLAEGCDAIVMTDADNSVNLGQIGLLLAPFAGGADVVIGDRKHAESVLVKAEARWGPGIVVLRHMQRMVGRASSTAAYATPRPPSSCTAPPPWPTSWSTRRPTASPSTPTGSTPPSPMIGASNPSPSPSSIRSRSRPPSLRDR